MIKLSIVIPIYNKERYLESTLQSIFTAAFMDCKNMEVILIDDESTDRSPEIAQKFTHWYPYLFKYYRINHVGGLNPANARNEGFKYVTGQYVMFFDADDIILPGYLKRAIDYMDSHDDCNMYIESEYDYQENNPYLFPRDCRIDVENNPNYIVSVASSIPIMLFGIMRTNLVKKMQDKFGLFEEGCYEDIKFTGLYLILFQGLHFNDKEFGRIYRSKVPESTCKYEEDELKKTGVHWIKDYTNYFNSKLGDYGFYIDFYNNDTQFNYFFPFPHIYFLEEKQAQ